MRGAAWADTCPKGNFSWSLTFSYMPMATARISAGAGFFLDPYD